MTISSNILEQIRLDLRLSPKEFCDKLDVDIGDYSTYLSSDDLRNFPEKAMTELKRIMLDLEEQNLKDFKTRIDITTDGIFTSSKILGHLDKLALLQSNPDQVGPITVEFHPTNQCNHGCPDCTFAISDSSRRKSEIGQAEFNIKLLPQLIDDLRKLGVKGIDISGGGEPTMHPKLATIISAFRQGGFDVGLVTNGSRLLSRTDAKQKKAKKLRQSILENCTWCRISVDAGSQAIYEKMHGQLPSVDFPHLVNAIKVIADEKMKTKSKTTLGVSFLLTPDNFLDLIKSICIFRDIPGIDYFQIKPIVIAPAERVNKPNMIFWDRRLFDALVVAKVYENPPSFKIYTLGFKFIDMLLMGGKGLPFSRCWGYPFYPTVAADGSILVCCHMLNNLFDGKSIGVYDKVTKEKSFLQIWKETDRAEKARQIVVRTTCPSNCKLSETNKFLNSFMGRKVEHKNFIN